MMLAAYRASVPAAVEMGRWHLPLVQDDERTLPDEELCKLSVARCARVSYLTHDGKRDRAKDLELYERLLGGGANGHWSPFEHRRETPAADPRQHSANFAGWEQCAPEAVPSGARRDVSRRIRRCGFRLALAALLLVLLAPAVAGAQTREDRHVTSAISSQTLLHASAVSLVDPVRQRRARAIADYQDLIFAGWAAAPILAFLWLWQSGNAARLRDTLRRLVRKQWLQRGAFTARRSSAARDGPRRCRLRSPDIASPTASGSYGGNDSELVPGRTAASGDRSR